MLKKTTQFWSHWRLPNKMTEHKIWISLSFFNNLHVPNRTSYIAEKKSGSKQNRSWTKNQKIGPHYSDRYGARIQLLYFFSIPWAVIDFLFFLAENTLLQEEQNKSRVMARIIHEWA